MIISHKHKFVFIHSPKTAGTSIRRLLSYNPYLNEDIIAGHWHGITEEQYNKFPHVSREIWTHTSALLGKEFFEEKGWDWDSYFKFGFIRNPWDRMMSSYRYLVEHIEDRVNPHPRNLQIYENYRHRPIKDFILERAKDPTVQYLCDKDKNLMVDFVGKYENLQEDMEKIIKMFVPQIKDCQWSLPHKNATKKTKHYHEFYDRDSREKVRSVSEKTIELGNYEFEVNKEYLEDEDANLAIAALDFFKASRNINESSYTNKDIDELRKKIYKNSFFW